MTLRQFDGFDTYTSTNELFRRWDAGSGGSPASGGRFGGNYYNANNTTVLQKTFDNQDTWIVGVAIYQTGLYSSQFLRFLDGATYQCSFSIDSTGTKIAAYRGNNTTLLGTSTAFHAATTWSYVEVKVKLHATLGTIDVKANGVSVLSLTGQNTISSANAYASIVQIISPSLGGVNAKLDDVYICDGVDATATQGAAYNDFLGAAPDGIRCSTLAPSGAGTTTQLTPSTGLNYACVDETPHNGDTDYVSSATVGQYDTYALANLSSSTGTVHAVRSVLVMRKDDAGARSAAPVLRSGGTDYTGTTVALTDSYAMYDELRTRDPNGTVAWTPTSVNALELGPKLVA